MPTCSSAKRCAELWNIVLFRLSMVFTPRASRPAKGMFIEKHGKVTSDELALESTVTEEHWKRPRTSEGQKKQKLTILV